MKIFVDDNALPARSGETILEAALRHGIDIPTLCHLKTENESASRYPASTSCLVCLVKVGDRFVPACATKVEDGMRIESETEEVRKLRRSSLELLLSDHRGDCHAPCQFGCPAHLDIPKMLREIRNGDDVSAIRTIKGTIPLPAVLGRVCPKPCEKICRRRGIDSSVEICAMKRYAADTDLASPHPYIPEPAPSSGKRIVVLGAGPSGLSAAYYLARLGHRVALYGQGNKPGGRLRRYDPSELPESVLDAELRTIFALPIDYYPEERLDWTAPEILSEIRRSFDALLLCTGPCEAEALERSGFDMERGRLRVDPKSFSTSIDGIFATGTIFRAKTTMIVRSVADGREAALSVDRFLRTERATSNAPLYSVKLGKLSPEETQAFAESVQRGAKPVSGGNAAREASRCLHCDCRGREKCLLLKHAEAYHAEPHRFEIPVRKKLQIRRGGNILYEPGKCIKCGLCITVAKSFGEEVGLAFVGRGFDVEIDVPFGETLEKALEKSAGEVVRVCPTAALSFDE